LVNSVSEPVGDLAVTSDLHLAPCRDSTSDNQRTGQSLQQNRPSVVLQLALSLPQLYARPGVGYASQVSSGQPRIEQQREDDQAANRHGQQGGHKQNNKP
jgi:hypothetical protein